MWYKPLYSPSGTGFALWWKCLVLFHFSCTHRQTSLCAWEVVLQCHAVCGTPSPQGGYRLSSSDWSQSCKLCQCYTGKELSVVVRLSLHKNASSPDSDSAKYFQTVQNVEKLCLCTRYTLQTLKMQCFELALWVCLSTTPRYLATCTIRDNGFSVSLGFTVQCAFVRSLILQKWRGSYNVTENLIGLPRTHHTTHRNQR